MVEKVGKGLGKEKGKKRKKRRKRGSRKKGCKERVEGVRRGRVELVEGRRERR